MGCRNLVFSAMILATFAVAPAQSPKYGLGRAPNADEIRKWDPVSPEGKELPAGSGTADQGAKIYDQKCAMCHGPNGKGGQAPALVYGPPWVHPTGAERHRLMPSVPFAPVVWDYINRAMPLLIAPGTLKPDEVYSLTAFLLYKNGVIKENDVMDAQTLPKVRMPNRDDYVPPVIASWKP